MLLTSLRRAECLLIEVLCSFKDSINFSTFSLSCKCRDHYSECCLFIYIFILTPMQTATISTYFIIPYFLKLLNKTANVLLKHKNRVGWEDVLTKCTLRETYNTFGCIYTESWLQAKCVCTHTHTQTQSHTHTVLPVNLIYCSNHRIKCGHQSWYINALMSRYKWTPESK